MTPTTPLHRWRDELLNALDSHPGPLQRVTVLDETDSTQDAARRLSARVGEVIVAGRQRSGRGRRGRHWADTGDEGIAVTCVLERRVAQQPMAISAAIAAAQTAEHFVQQSVTIKWPNDVLVSGRKLAGVLIEQIERTALLGIGMNVSQSTWPQSLERRAVSLKQLGVMADRCAVLTVLLGRLNTALQLDEQAIAHEYARRDMLVGHSVRLTTGNRRLTARVLQVDPLRGLLVSEGGCEQWLPAATTTLAPS